MTLDEACAVLRDHTDRHGTTPLIADGHALRFQPGPTYPPAAIAGYEASIGRRLPADYARFLSTVGAGRLFVHDHGLGIDFVPLEQLRESSHSVFHNFGDDPYPDLLLAVHVPGVGGFGGFVLDGSAEGGESFSVFSAEDDPAAWVGEATLCSFEQWLVGVCESNGRRVWV